MTLQKEFYFLSPVETVKVTSQNLQEVAEWCGGKVAKTESRRVAGRMDSYVWVPTPKGTAISWAFPGMFITKRLVVTVKGEMRVTYAVFRRDYFEKNYFKTPKDAVDKTWEKGMDTPNKQQKNKKHPKMAGKPTELQVTIPPGTPAEEVEEAMSKAVAVLEEQGVIKHTEKVTDAALEAIANASPDPVADGSSPTPREVAQGNMSPAEQRMAGIEAVVEYEANPEATQ